MTELSAEELFDEVFTLSPYDRPREVLELADRHFGAMAARAVCAHDAETCRLAMLAALVRDAHGPAAKWRARALARFAMLGWREGAASILMGGALAELGRVNRDYPNGKTLDVIRPSEDALAIMDELELFAEAAGSGISVGSRSPTPRLIARFWLEKRGFLLLLLQRYGEARASYARAAVVAEGNRRSELRVPAGAALVEYLAPDGDPAAALATTLRVLERAADRADSDVNAAATHNVGVMRAGRRNLLSYEIL